MKAMILAAGLGTRLRPLTEYKPKALVPIVNIPIINRAINYLKSYGVSSIVVNAHHRHNQLCKYLGNGRQLDLDIDVRIEPEILGTGGGLKNTEDFWDNEPFIVINSDILTDINLELAYGHHKESGSLATLILHDREPFNQVKINSNNELTDISQKNLTDRLAFTGIHIIEPDLLSYIPGNGYSGIVSIYRHLITSKESISAYISEKHYWRDIGSIDSYFIANREMLGDDVFNIGPGTTISQSAGLEEWCVIGEKCHIGKNVEISRSILWDKVTVKEGIKITDSIITSSKSVDRDLDNEIF
ncbi:sugar phosphate nucleotidyltransferase [Thermodesulfobacteriota bacterium]